MFLADALTNMTFILFGAFITSIFVFSRSHIGKVINGRDLSLSLLGSNKKDKKYVFKKLYVKDNDKFERNVSLVINRDGVFLFYYVSERGMLYGRENEDEWYSSVYKTDKPKYYFQNPTKRIKYLCKTLENEFNIKNIHPFIVFLDGRLNNIHTEIYTIYPMDIRNSFKLFHTDNPVYSVDELNELYVKIKDYNALNKKIYKELRK